MLIQTIQKQAEQQFIKRLDEYNRHNVGHGVLLCAFSTVPLRITEPNALMLLTDILQDYQAEIYFCIDGDIFISWCGKITVTKELIIKAFLAQYLSELEHLDRAQLFQFFDSQVQVEDLRLAVQLKLSKLQQPDIVVVDAEPPRDIIVWNQRFSEKQLRALKFSVSQRSYRKVPEVLVVEDQDFSRKLLVGLFEKDRRCYGAQNAEQAVAIYAEHAPEVVFLDVELPDLDGHALATLIKRYDPQSYIVMVTANNYARDVEAAKANKVQGFIIKPYNKQKIMGAFDAYLQRRPKKP